MNKCCAELGSAEHWVTFADTFISSKAQGIPSETNPSLADSEQKCSVLIPQSPKSDLVLFAFCVGFVW